MSKPDNAYEIFLEQIKSVASGANVEFVDLGFYKVLMEAPGFELRERVGSLSDFSPDRVIDIEITLRFRAIDRELSAVIRAHIGANGLFVPRWTEIPIIEVQPDDLKENPGWVNWVKENPDRVANIVISILNLALTIARYLSK